MGKNAFLFAYLFFKNKGFFPLPYGYYRILDTVPCAVSSMTLLCIHSAYDSLHLLTPQFQSIPPLCPRPRQPQVCCLCRWVYFCFVNKFICLFSVQFSSVAQSCPTLWDPMNCSTPGLPVHHHLPEFTQTHVHWVSDAIQPSHALSSPSPPALNPSQHQSLFQWVNSSHEVAKVLEFQL